MLIRLSVFLLVLLFPIACISADNEVINTLPDSNTASFRTNSRTFWQNELPDVLGRLFSRGWVYTGGTFTAAQTSGVNSPAFATEAFTSSGNRVTANGSGGAASIAFSSAVGCAATDTAWVIISAASGNSLNNFERSGTSNYFVDCVSSTEPTLPADSAWLMRVSLTTSAITAVAPLAQTYPVNAFTLLGMATSRDCGARIDGVTNDSVAIQRCLDTYSTVLLPAGTSIIASGLILNRHNVLIGVGTCDQGIAGGSILSYTGTGIAINATDTVNPGYRWGGAVRNLCLNTSTGTHGIRVSQLSEFQITHNRIRGFSVAGIDLLGVLGGATINIYIDHNYIIENTGIGISSNGANNVNNQIVVHANRIQGNTGVGLSITNLVSGWSITANDIEGNGVPQADLNGIGGGEFNGNYLESVGAATSILRLSNTHLIQGLVVNGNIFQGAGIGITTNCILVGAGVAVTGITIQGNSLNGCTNGINPNIVAGAIFGPNRWVGAVTNHVAVPGVTSRGIIQHDEAGSRWYGGTGAALHAYRFDGVLQLGTAVTAGASIRDQYIGNGGAIRWTDTSDTVFAAKLRKLSPIVTNGSTASLGYENSLLFIVDSLGNNAIYNIRGGNNVAVELLDSQGAYTVIPDNAGTTNIYYLNNDYLIQNRTGTNPMTYHVFYFSATQ